MTIVHRIAIVGLIALLMFVMCAMVVHAENAIYPDVGVITEIDEEQDLVYITSLDGNMWVYEGIEDLMIGDILAIIFDTMGTKCIYDDQIIQIKYCGYIEW